MVHPKPPPIIRFPGRDRHRPRGQSPPHHALSFPAWSPGKRSRRVHLTIQRQAIPRSLSFVPRGEFSLLTTQLALDCLTHELALALSPDKKAAGSHEPNSLSLSVRHFYAIRLCVFSIIVERARAHNARSCVSRARALAIFPFRALTHLAHLYVGPRNEQRAINLSALSIFRCPISAVRIYYRDRHTPRARTR